MSKNCFEILPGLPPYGPPAIAFSADGSGTHREGLVIQFNAKEKWIGNFLPGCTRFSTVIPHPDTHHIIAISGGQGYVITPDKKAIEYFGGSIEQVLRPENADVIVFMTSLWFEFFSTNGFLSKTKRLSWDGMRNVKIIDNKIVGEGWMFDDTWHKFEVDLDTGESTGGSYYEPGE